MLRQADQDGFSEPQTFPPIESVYWMQTPVGMPGGHEAHSHPETIEVCFIRRGRLDWWIGEKSYEVHSGDVLVMRPGEPHGSVDSTLQPCEYYAVHLKPALLGVGAQDAANSASFGGHYPGRTDLGTKVQRIFEEHTGRDAFRAEVCLSLANLLVISLARSGNTPTIETSNYLVRSAIQRFSGESGLTKSVDAVAKELRVSTVWLTRLFRQEVGQSPGEWVRSQKMLEAKRRLATGEGSVIEIAVDLGFASSQYFATAFRRDTGLSPTAYRQRCESGIGMLDRSEIVETFR